MEKKKADFKAGRALGVSKEDANYSIHFCVLALTATGTYYFVVFPDINSHLECDAIILPVGGSKALVS